MWVNIQRMELRYWWEYGDERTRLNQSNEKRSLIAWGLRVPIWKMNFCSSVLRQGKGCKLPCVVQNDQGDYSVH